MTRQQLPQLLPADPDRERRRRRAAAAPGRARRRRPGPAPARHPARTCARLPRRPNWWLGDVRRSSSTARRTSSSRRTTSTPSSPRSAASSRRATAASRPPRTGSRPRATSSRSATVRGAYAGVRANERAEDRGEAPDVRPGRRRQDRRPRGPPDHRRRPATRIGRSQFAADDHPRIDALAATYVVDGAALEVLRLTELAPRLPRLRGRARAPRRARLRRADRRRHPAVQDPAQRPAPLAAPVPLHPGRRVPGRQRRPDRAHRAARPDAGPARQRHGRRRRRPVDLPVPRRQLRGLRRVRRAVRAAAGARPGRRRRPARRRASGSSRTSARSGTS